MATPEVPQELHDRLGAVEDTVQELRFVHMVKVDACTTGLGILYGQQQRMREELAGFRGEVAAEFGAMKTDLETVKAEQARQGEMLAEILRRLSS